jgi:hypothetical protein
MIGCKMGVVGSGGVTIPFAFGNALQFDGVDDYVQFPKITFSTSTDFTISQWIKFDAVFKIWITNSGSVTNYLFAISSTQIRLQTGTGGLPPDRIVFTVPPMSINTWYNVVVSRISGNITLYLNGTAAGSAVANSNTLALDSLSGYSGFQWDGLLDEVAIWNGTGATATNAADLYNSGNGALASDIIPSPTAYWRMDESGSDPIAIDSGGNGNNGTLNNFTLPGAWVTH